MQSQSDEHLRLLSIFQYVFAGLTGLVGLLPVLHLTFGVAMVSGTFPGSHSGSGPPAAFGWFFIAIALIIITLLESLALCSLLVGRYLATRRAWLFCFIVACLQCIFMVPLGTALGVFTIIVLLRPEVKQQFGVT